MPRRELRDPAQVEAWLEEWGRELTQPGELTLIGSGALLWHAYRQSIRIPLPENSMDVDPITRDEGVAELGYAAQIGSSFEREKGWHVNLMPFEALQGLPEGWTERAARKQYGPLSVIVPSPADLLVPKLRRGEPRDHAHAAWARQVGLC